MRSSLQKWETMWIEFASPSGKIELTSKDGWRYFLETPVSWSVCLVEKSAWELRLSLIGSREKIIACICWSGPSGTAPPSPQFQRGWFRTMRERISRRVCRLRASLPNLPS